MTSVAEMDPDVLTYQDELTSLDCAIIRGGSSKGVFLPRSVLPDDQGGDWRHARSP